MKGYKGMSKKKKIVIAIVAVLALALIAGGVTLLILKPWVEPPATKASADAIRVEATAAIKAKDTAKAKELLQQAQEQYVELKDTDNAISTQAQIYVLEHPIVYE